MRCSHVGVLLLGGCRIVLGLADPTLAPDAGGPAQSDAVARPPDALASDALAPLIRFVQGNCAEGSGTVAQASYAPQTAGDLDVVVVRYDSGTNLVTLSDTAGNTWTQIGSPIGNNTATMSLYFASGVAAGSDEVTAEFDASTVTELRLLEYAGIAVSDPVDGTAGGVGNSTNESSGPATTMHAYDLLVLADDVEFPSTADPAYMTRLQCTHGSVGDAIVSVAGTYTATATEAPAGGWLIRLAAFAGLR